MQGTLMCVSFILFNILMCTHKVLIWKLAEHIDILTTKWISVQRKHIQNTVYNGLILAAKLYKLLTLQYHESISLGSHQRSHTSHDLHSCAKH